MVNSIGTGRPLDSEMPVLLGFPGSANIGDPIFHSFECQPRIYPV